MSSSFIRRFVEKRRAEAGIHLANQDNDLVVIESAEAAAKHDCREERPANDRASDLVSEIP